jgi:hypothetical protein
VNGDSDDAEALGEHIMLTEAVALRLRCEPEGITDEADRDGNPLAIQHGGDKLITVNIDALNPNRALRKLGKVSHAYSKQRGVTPQ